ncbi:MAG TPA: hypothetical protein VIK28_07285, partial [Sedimentisphaerales bacterium]
CDILVNNVGGTIPGTLWTFTVEKWREIIDYAVTCPDLGRPANVAKYFKSSSIAPLRLSLPKILSGLDSHCKGESSHH